MLSIDTGWSLRTITWFRSITDCVFLTFGAVWDKLRYVFAMLLSVAGHIFVPRLPVHICSVFLAFLETSERAIL